MYIHQRYPKNSQYQGSGVLTNLVSTLTKEGAKKIATKIAKVAAKEVVKSAAVEGTKKLGKVVASKVAQMAMPLAGPPTSTNERLDALIEHLATSKGVTPTGAAKSSFNLNNYLQGGSISIVDYVKQHRGGGLKTID